MYINIMHHSFNPNTVTFPNWPIKKFTFLNRFHKPKIRPKHMIL